MNTTNKCFYQEEPQKCKEKVEQISVFDIILTCCLIAEGLGMYIQHLAFTIAQVPPGASIRMSNTIQFWRTACLVSFTSSFRRQRPAEVLFKAC